jgi:GT2 family glycosyltransferase
MPENRPPLGIAVTTFQRLPWLSKCVESIVDLTEVDYHLVVADDGSDDGTTAWCRERGIRIITGRNRGVAHNKNRGLLVLEALGCDPILIFEDDLRPGLRGWESEWIAATGLWHHVAFGHKGIVRTAVAGAGTAADPWVSPRTTAQLLTISATVLRMVGYFDPRYEGWGHEHADWTSRIKRAGYGFKTITLPTGNQFQAQLFLNYGMINDPAPSWRNDEQAQLNQEKGPTHGEPIFRVPWRTYDERSELLEEVHTSGMDLDTLAERLGDRAQQSASRRQS